MVGPGDRGILRRDRSALGFTACNSEEWLAHKGTVGQVKMGVLHILDDDMNECPTGEVGTLWFETATPFEYFDDAEKTREARSARSENEHGWRYGLCR